MPSRFGKSSLVAILVVFGLAVLMILKGYDPAVITAVVTGTSIAAAELIRRLSGGTSGEDS